MATDGVLTQVCVECGKEYFFDDEPPPDDLACERCGNAVFRSYFDATIPGEAAIDFRESTERDTATDDPGTDVTSSDLNDLNNP